MDVMELIVKGEPFVWKALIKGYYYDLNVVPVDNKLQLHFGYNKDLLDEVKSTFENRKWLGIDGGPKVWSIPITQRNIFRLNVLGGKYGLNMYANFTVKDYTKEITEFVEQRGLKPYKHQVEMINHAISTGSFIWAAEMGTGKTLASIILMELTKLQHWFWIGTKGAIVSVKLDFEKWGSRIQPIFLTYESLRDIVENWQSGMPAPQGVIFDEASRLKNPNAKRTIAAMHLANSIRSEHKKSIVGLLSGTPAPKSPVDWWSLSEIACPGFFREGSTNEFMRRLAITEQCETITGAGAYTKILGWRDDDNKCDICGRFKDDPVHLGIYGNIHTFRPCNNEVSNLAKRMKGLTGVWLKKDCLDLPEKRFEIISVKPTRETLNIADLITKKSRRAVEALTLLRELSDGFQYKETPTGKKQICPLCKERGKIVEYVSSIDVSRVLSDEEIDAKVQFVYDDDYNIIDRVPIILTERGVECPHCQGIGQVDIIERTMIEVFCPKDEVVKNELENHEDVQRLNIYAGFTGSIDRVVKMVQREGWHTIRVDGRGWIGYNPSGGVIGNDPQELMKLYTNVNNEDRYAFIGHPASAGMGLTLTVSPTTLFFSNDFNAESRQQAVDRGHRIGMDVVRGGRILDIVHLKSDQLILDNLGLKRDLQHLSMLGIQKGIRDD